LAFGSRQLNRFNSMAATVLLSVALSACTALPVPPKHGPAPISRQEGQETFATAYGTIADKYIEPQTIEDLAVNGLNGLSRIDTGFSVSIDDEWLTLLLDGIEKESFSRPASNDVEGWAALTFDAYSVARNSSPEIAAADASRIYQVILETALAPLDRFSRYATAKKAKDNRAKRSGYGGIGLRYKVDGGTVIVTDVFSGAPADRSGIKTGDRITRIDGVPTENLSQDEVKEMLRGHRGLSVSLVINRTPGQPSKQLTLFREKIVIPTVKVEMLDDIAHVSISGFNRNTPKEMREVLENLATGSKLSGLALDLRGNPGGLLKQAIQVADLFLSDGRIVSQKGRHPGSTQVYDADPEIYLAGLPIVVLIDGRTASAAEVLAATLQDRNRGVIVGTSSYGKGTVQTVIRLVNRGELTLTWSRLIPPSGYVMHELGVLPSICTNVTESKEATTGADQAISRVLATQEKLDLRAQSWRDLSYNARTERDALRNDCPAVPQKSGPHLEIANRLLHQPATYRSLISGSTPSQTASPH